jgi:hypothetical protein
MLAKAGADTTYLQKCTVSVWQRGKKESGFVFTENGQKRTLSLCALGNSVATSPGVLTASIVEIEDFSKLYSLRQQLQGKIVFFNLSMNPEYINTFRAYGEAGTGRRSGAAQASKYGAAGVMVRSLASNIDDHPHTGATTYNDSFPKIPAIAVSTSDAEWLHNELQRRKEVKVSFTVSSEKKGDKESANVIGELRGSEFPDEIITVGGHLDSWDLGEGAHDDGAGCVQSIEIIRAFTALGIKPKRTIRVVLFMNEENGGAGSKAYHRSAKEKKEKLLFALEVMQEVLHHVASPLI